MGIKILHDKAKEDGVDYSARDLYVHVVWT